MDWRLSKEEQEYLKACLKQLGEVFIYKSPYTGKLIAFGIFTKTLPLLFTIKLK